AALSAVSAAAATTAAAAAAPALPPGIHEAHGIVVPAAGRATSTGCVLEVLSVVDVGNSAWSYVDTLHHAIEDAKIAPQFRKPDTPDPLRKAVNSLPRAMLRLLLTDGFQTVVAMEYRRIRFLSLLTPPGTKIAVRDAAIRRGVLYLTEENTTILGEGAPEPLEALATRLLNLFEHLTLERKESMQFYPTTAATDDDAAEAADDDDFLAIGNSEEPVRGRRGARRARGAARGAGRGARRTRGGGGGGDDDDSGPARGRATRSRAARSTAASRRRGGLAAADYPAQLNAPDSLQATAPETLPALTFAGGGQPGSYRAGSVNDDFFDDDGDDDLYNAAFDQLEEEEHQLQLSNSNRPIRDPPFANAASLEVVPPTVPDTFVAPTTVGTQGLLDPDATQMPAPRVYRRTINSASANTSGARRNFTASANAATDDEFQDTFMPVDDDGTLPLHDAGWRLPHTVPSVARAGPASAVAPRTSALPLSSESCIDLTRDSSESDHDYKPDPVVIDAASAMRKMPSQLYFRPDPLVASGTGRDRYSAFWTYLANFAAVAARLPSGMILVPAEIVDVTFTADAVVIALDDGTLSVDAVLGDKDLRGMRRALLRLHDFLAQIRCDQQQQRRRPVVEELFAQDSRFVQCLVPRA
ncbi:hypothetical protein HK405_009945, partial [Cladochytrium tenue]